MGSSYRRRVCAEPLETRRLLSAVLADVHDAVAGPPTSLTSSLAVMNAATLYPLSDCPQFSSKPGAPATLYLDFVGDTTATWGSFSPGTTPAYDTNGDPTTFSSAELSSIASIWEQVADTYSPFNINVTTINPGNVNNPNLEVVIGSNGSWTWGIDGIQPNSLSGIAYIGSFAGSTGLFGANKNKVFVFSAELGNGVAKYVADDAEHEAGHAYGLSHHSVWTQNGATWTLTAEYYTGTSAGGPIMGNPFSDTRALWWDGVADYLGTNGSPYIQDDLSIISSAANGFGYAPDDYGNTIATAYPLTGSTSFSANGVVGTNTDADFFSFTVYSGSVTLSVNPGAPLSDPNPTLNANLELFNPSGTLLATGTQTTLNKSITTTLAAGTYYAEVSGDGTYGDLGDYTLNITGPAAPSIQPDRYEPNDSFAQATDFGPTVSQTQASLSINTSSDVDYYSFTPVSAGNATANISFTASSGNLDLYLYNQNQTLLASSTTAGASTQSVTTSVVGGQKYYLLVTGANGATNPSYTLNITAPSPSWLNASGGSYSFSGTGASPGLTINSGTVSLVADAGASLSNLNITVKSGANLQIQTTQHLHALLLDGSAKVDVAAGSQSTLVLNNLELAPQSTLDLADNSLQVSIVPLSTIQSLITSGYNGGAWNGPGIISSVAATSMTHGLGYSDAVIAGAVLVKYTWYGDANLDGVINNTDVNLINAGQNATNAGWQDGDFDYDGKITADDFLRMSFALAFQSTTSG